MGPKLMNCCKLESMGTKECGKMLKRIQVPAEGQKRRITRKEYQKLVNKFEMEGFMSWPKREGLWNLVREKSAAG